MLSSKDDAAQMLSSEALRVRFGEIHLEILAQDERRDTRVSCVRRTLDDAPLAYSTVRFFPEGVTVLGPHHERITKGGLLGETVVNSGVAFRRTVSAITTISTSYAARFLFGTDASLLQSRTVEYHIDGQRYCRIREMYNPVFFAGRDGITELAHDDASFVIGRLRPTYSDDYLRLTHGFLQKDIHVGIRDVDEYVLATARTLAMLFSDPNTHMFVAADNDRFIGYVALNIHPALHLNGLECVVRELYVADGFRRQGVASALVNYTERFARLRGCKRISLATAWENEVQRQFYQSMGLSRRCDFATRTL